LIGDCSCQRGYWGKYCENVCPFGHYGYKCQHICRCQAGSKCDPVNGIIFSYFVVFLNINIHIILSNIFVFNKNVIK